MPSARPSDTSGRRPAGELGVAALVSIGIAGMVDGGIFSVLGPTWLFTPVR